MSRIRKDASVARATTFMFKLTVLIFGSSLVFAGFLSELNATTVKHDQKSFEQIKTEAERGDADAEYELGRRYYTGDGTPKDLVEAVKWVRKAADHGLAIAQGALGAHYFYGEGVPKDNTEAVKWYRKAAEQGL